MRMRKERKLPKVGICLFVIGTLCFIAARSFMVYNRHESNAARVMAKSIVEQLVDLIGETKPVEDLPPDYVLNPDMDMPTEEIEGNRYIGTVVIPALGVELPVMSEWSYEKLKISPCRYAGSAYMDNMVIAAHNYNSHFGKLSSLPQGEPVLFKDVDGNEFRYKTALLEILLPENVDEMIAGDYPLTLFTCTPGGRTRVTVRCIKES